MKFQKRANRPTLLVPITITLVFVFCLAWSAPGGHGPYQFIFVFFLSSLICSRRLWFPSHRNDPCFVFCLVWRAPWSHSPHRNDPCFVFCLVWLAPGSHVPHHNNPCFCFCLAWRAPGGDIPHCEQHGVPGRLQQLHHQSGHSPNSKQLPTKNQHENLFKVHEGQ